MELREHIFGPGATLDAAGRNIRERGEADVRELMESQMGHGMRLDECLHVSHHVTCDAWEGHDARLATDTF
jgi:hypothetical protein